MSGRSRTPHKLHGVGSQRSSQRSHGTSSSSSQESKFVCKEFSRKFISFMCTQVGVGGLMISYAMIGAFTFIKIEGHNNMTLTNLTNEIHNKTIKEMWTITEKHNLLNREEWNFSINAELYKFQKQMVEKITKDGYDGRSRSSVWGDFSSTLMFCLSVFTMIGYGHMTPRTDLGKIATMVYACFGIPLYIVYFMSMGKVFAKSFKFMYRSCYRCLNKKGDEQDIEQNSLEDTIIVVPSTACIWVMILYMCIGTLMFGIWEDWNYLDAWYFSFTSLAKIGIGDFVPGKLKYGEEKLESTDGGHWKLLINFMYLLIGMGLIAMCCTLMKEEILLKLNATKEEIREKCYYCGIRLGLYSEDQPVLVSQPKYRQKMIKRTASRR